MSGEQRDRESKPGMASSLWSMYQFITQFKKIISTVPFIHFLNTGNFYKI